MKRSSLKRRAPLRARRKPPLNPAVQVAREAWKTPTAGFCQCGCSRFTMHLERHHVVYQQHVRVEKGNEWDLSNSMLLHPRCHSMHHTATRRIPIEFVPAPALEFAVRLFGEGRATLYLQQRYNCEVSL